MQQTTESIWMQVYLKTGIYLPHYIINKAVFNSTVNSYFTDNIIYSEIKHKVYSIS